MRIKRTTYRKVPPKMKRQLSGLGHRDGNLRSSARQSPDSTVILALEGDGVLGWALLEHQSHWKYPELQLWVRATCRRQGVGTKLVMAAIKMKSCISIYRGQAPDFFESLPKRKLVKMRGWRIRSMGKTK